MGGAHKGWASIRRWKSQSELRDGGGGGVVAGIKATAVGGLAVTC